MYYFCIYFVIVTTVSGKGGLSIGQLEAVSAGEKAEEVKS
jgi:hypothetical protein